MKWPLFFSRDVFVSVSHLLGSYVTAYTSEGTAIREGFSLSLKADHNFGTTEAVICYPVISVSGHCTCEWFLLI